MFIVWILILPRNFIYLEILRKVTLLLLPLWLLGWWQEHCHVYEHLSSPIHGFSIWNHPKIKMCIQFFFKLIYGISWNSESYISHLNKYCKPGPNIQKKIFIYKKAYYTPPHPIYKVNNWVRILLNNQFCPML